MNKTIKDEKIKMKTVLEKNKKTRDNDLNLKQKYVKTLREISSRNRQRKKIEAISQKKMNYQTSLNDKYLMKIIKEQLNIQYFNKNTYNHAKIKQEYNEFEAKKMKKNLERENQLFKLHESNIIQLKQLEEEMLNTCNQLEEVERQAIERLNKTKNLDLELSNDYNVNHYKKNKQFNKSMEIIHSLHRNEDNKTSTKTLNDRHFSPRIPKNINFSTKNNSFKRYEIFKSNKKKSKSSISINAKPINLKNDKFNFKKGNIDNNKGKGKKISKK